MTCAEAIVKVARERIAQVVYFVYSLSNKMNLQREILPTQ